MLKYIFIISSLFLSGCGTLEFISNVSTVKTIKEFITQEKSEEVEEAEEEETFYSSSYDWNNAKKIEIKPDPTRNTSSEQRELPEKEEKPEKKPISLPLILMAVLSALFYIINRIRLSKLR
jgi:hypothetical protein